MTVHGLGAIHGERQIVGTLLSVNTTGFELQVHDDDEDGEPTVYSFPGDADILDAEVVVKLGGVPPINLSSRALESTPDWLIYADGSGVTGAGPAGAALVIKHMSSKKAWAMGTFSPSSTNNCGEYVAGCAALRMSAILPGTIAVLGDSEFFFKTVTGKQKCSKPHLSELYKQGRDLWIGLDQQRVSLHHMDGHGASPMLADPVAKLAKNHRLSFCCLLGEHIDSQVNVTVEGIKSTSVTRIDVGPHSLEIPKEIFPAFPHVLAKTAKVPAPHQLPEVAAADANAAPISKLEIKSVEDYLSIRALGARSDVPRQVRAQWAGIQRAALQKVLDASSVEEANAAMFDFMTLPNRWLPRRCATRRVIDHFKQNKPFNVERPKATDKVEKQKHKRLAEIVTRKAKDFNIRGAVDVLRREAETPSTLNEEERFAALRKKFYEQEKVELKRELKDENLPMMPASVLESVVKKMKRTAAPCIDGWCKAMVSDAFVDEPELINLWCALLTRLLRGQIGPLVMACLKLARLVPIPKPCGGVRPIAVSNFILKMMGAAALQLDGAACREWQYAIGNKAGTRIIAHKLREHKEKGHTIAKFDLSNGFGELPRRIVEHLLASRQSPWLKAYFRLYACGPRTMAVFGSNGVRTFHVADGFCQGDATSCFFFCLGIDYAIEKILQQAQQAGIEVQGVYAFVDDISWALKSAADAARLAQIVKTVFAEMHMQINLSSSKSACMIPEADPYWSMPELQEQFRLLNYHTQNTHEGFVVVGADISNNPIQFLNDYALKQLKFFDLLTNVDLHPAILFTILRTCGSPRLEYLCSVMPPSQKLREVAARFDDLILRTVNSPALLGGLLRQGHHDLLWDMKGAGFPRYATLCGELYETSKRFSQRGSAVPRVGLVTTNTSLPVHLQGATDHHGNWMLYKSLFSFDMDPCEYITALCLKLNVLPEKVPPAKCNCGVTVTSDPEFIDHAFACDRFTGFTHVHRHNLVMDCLLAASKAYGIQATAEPNFYTYDDDEGKGKACRPDITFHTTPPLATDITVVSPQYIVDQAASVAATMKVKKHRAACEKMGHLFEPFPLEIQGHMNQCCDRVIAHLQRSMAPMYRLQFRRDVNNAVSVALARGRAQAVRSAIARVYASLR